MPGRRDEFRSGVDCAIKYASALGCSPGELSGRHRTPDDVDPNLLHATLVTNLSYAADRMKEAGTSDF